MRAAARYRRIEARRSRRATPQPGVDRGGRHLLRFGDGLHGDSQHHVTVKGTPRGRVGRGAQPVEVRLGRALPGRLQLEHQVFGAGRLVERRFRVLVALPGAARLPAELLTTTSYTTAVGRRPVHGDHPHMGSQTLTSTMGLRSGCAGCRSRRRSVFPHRAAPPFWGPLQRLAGRPRLLQKLYRWIVDTSSPWQVMDASRNRKIRPALHRARHPAYAPQPGQAGHCPCSHRGASAEVEYDR